MGEVFRDETGQAVSLGIMSATNVSVKFMKGGATYTGNVVGTMAQIPYAIVQSDGECTVEWTYKVDGVFYNRTEQFSVVTPLFTKAELTEHNPQFATLTEAQYQKLERMTRKVIETITGQTFGQERGTITVTGNGMSTIYLKKRILSLSGTFSAAPYTIVHDGFGIRVSRPSAIGATVAIPTITADRVYNEYPYAKGGVFQRNTTYSISGVFGWATVPTDVKEAALIVAERFSCNEAAWRDRYVESIKAADWFFKHSDRAFSGTGSATADALLAKYVVNVAAVI